MVKKNITNMLPFVSFLLLLFCLFDKLFLLFTILAVPYFTVEPEIQNAAEGESVEVGLCV